MTERIKVRHSRGRDAWWFSCERPGCHLFEFWPLAYPIGWVLDRVRLHLIFDCPTD